MFDLEHVWNFTINGIFLPSKYLFAVTAKLAESMLILLNAIFLIILLVRENLMTKHDFVHAPLALPKLIRN